MDRRDAKRHLFRRFVTALVSGNGDLHLGNLSMLGIAPQVRFSPVYDPAPMRAYSRHNLLCPIPFGDYGEFAGTDEHLVGFHEALTNFVRNLGLRQDAARREIGDLLDAARDWPERIESVESLPDEHKARLADIGRKIQARLREFVTNR